MEGLFKDTGIISMFETANLKRIENVSPFISLVFDTHCRKEDTTLVSKAFATHTKLVVVLCNKQDVEVNS